MEDGAVVERPELVAAPIAPDAEAVVTPLPLPTIHDLREHDLETRVAAAH